MPLLPVIYLCAISIGFPVTTLGAAWPVIHGDLGVPISAAGIAQVKLCRKGDRVTLESFRFTPCCISSSPGTQLDSFVPNAYTLNNYQPTPYLENGEAWKRTMSILDGAYAGANFVPSYWTILNDMAG